MPVRKYDAAKAHEYYMRTRELKGRKHGSMPEPTSQRKPSQQAVSSAQEKVHQIEAKLSQLRALLQKKIAESKSSTSSSSSKKDGPTTADKLKARADSKQYYDKHKNEIKNDRAQKGRQSGGGSSSGPKDVSGMSVTELKAEITKVVTQLKQAIADAKRLRGG